MGYETSIKRTGTANSFLAASPFSVSLHMPPLSDSFSPSLPATTLCLSLPLPWYVRFVFYVILGWTAEILWTAVRQRRRHLRGYTYLYMAPIYGSAALLFDLPYDAVASRAWWPLRGLLFGITILFIEYIAGWTLHRLLGRCPWDYNRPSPCRWSLHGYIRFDYLPAWVVLGYVLEQVHRALYIDGGLLLAFSPSLSPLT